jgi:hypothetical protein
MQATDRGRRNSGDLFGSRCSAVRARGTQLGGGPQSRCVALYTELSPTRFQDFWSEAEAVAGLGATPIAKPLAARSERDKSNGTWRISGGKSNTRGSTQGGVVPTSI